MRRIGDPTTLEQHLHMTTAPKHELSPSELAERNAILHDLRTKFDLNESEALEALKCLSF